MPELNIKLVIEGREANATLNLTKEQLAQISKEAAQAGETTSSSLSKMGNIVTGINQGLELAKKGFEILSKPMEAAGQFEQYETSLKVMLGSTEAAKARLAELVEFAKTTPFELPQVVQAANQLQAIGKYSQENLRMLGDLASASGKPMEQALSAYSKLMTGQKGVAIDMFRDLLISATDWAEATGAKIGANGELQASVEQMAEALPKILQKKGFDGMMTAQSETFNGMVSNMKDAFGQFETAMGQKLLPIGKQVAQFLGGIAASMTSVKTNAEQVNETAAQQRLEFEKLVIQYEDLRGKSNKTNDEAERYNGIIKTLQERYPDILGKMDLQKGKLDDLRLGFQQVRDEMEKNIRLELNRAKAKDIMAEQQEYEAKRDEAKQQMDEAKAKLSLIKQGKLADETYASVDPEAGSGGGTKIETLGQRLSHDVQVYTERANDAVKVISEKQKEIDRVIMQGVAEDKAPEATKPKSGSATAKGNKKWYGEDGQTEAEALKNRDKNLQELAQNEELSLLQDFNDTKAKMRQESERTFTKLTEEGVENRKKARDIEVEAEYEFLQWQQEWTDERIELEKKKQLAKEESTKSDIEVGMQQYDAEKSLGEQMKVLIRERIMAIIAEAVMTQIAKVIATVPWPFNLILAPVAGLALQGLLEGLIPKFEKGGLAPAGQLIMMNERGSEYIVNAQATREYLPYLQAMNAGIDPFNSLLNMRMALSTSGGSNANAHLLEDIRNLLREAPRYKLQIGDRDASDLNLRADRRLYKET